MLSSPLTLHSVDRFFWGNLRLWKVCTGGVSECHMTRQFVRWFASALWYGPWGWQVARTSNIQIRSTFEHLKCQAGLMVLPSSHDSGFQAGIIHIPWPFPYSPAPLQNLQLTLNAPRASEGSLTLVGWAHSGAPTSSLQGGFPGFMAYGATLFQPPWTCSRVSSWRSYTTPFNRPLWVFPRYKPPFLHFLPARFQVTEVLLLPIPLRCPLLNPEAVTGTYN